MRKFIAIAIALTAVFTACRQPLSAPPTGTGLVRISIDGISSQARTIFPAKPDVSALYYTYSFTKGGTAKTPVENGGVYTLETGNDWAVTVDAYLEAGHINQVGTSGAVPFTVTDSAAVQDIGVTIAPRAMGTGTLTYTIAYPDGLATADVTLVNVDTTPFTLAAGSSSGGTITITDVDAPAPAGYYDLKVALEDSLGRTAGKTDVVHVYDNMLTEIPGADWTFTTADFTATLITAASVTGLSGISTATGETPAPTGSLTPGAAGYTVLQDNWQVKTGAPDTWTNFTGSVFKPLAEYRRLIVLRAVSGHKFSGAITPGVDGGTASAGTISADVAMNELTFTVTFPATAGGIAKVPDPGFTWVDTTHTLTATAGAAIAPGQSITITLTDLPSPGYGSDIVWSLNGADVQTGGLTYTFDSAGKNPGVYAVGIRVKKDGWWYDSETTVTLAKAALVLDGYTGATVTVNYISRAADTGLLVGDGGIVLLPSAVSENEIIKSVQLGSNTHLIGRKASGAIKLKSNAAGALSFRDPDGGYTPIGSYAEFQLINTASGRAAGTKYKQEADLDLLGDTVPPTVWTTIGDYYNRFLGEFDGGGYTIDNMRITGSANYVGLFGYVDASGTINNVHIGPGSSVAGNQVVGSIVGHSEGIITACSNAGSVTSTGSYTGGVTGNSYGTMKACFNTGTVSGSEYIGGVAGYNRGTIIACYNTGAVSGMNATGGVVGRNVSGSIIACYNTGAVNRSIGSNTAFGGVSGDNDNTGTIIACYWKDVPGDYATLGVSNAAGTISVEKFGKDAWPTAATDTGATYTTAWKADTVGDGTGGYWKNPLRTYNASYYPRLWWE
ncbi:hypothetical protein AGMMS49928_12230 [Spirochaetia bacterium]|nr:hypothetical protein AGMMS49928_12230 [Spirochaetia bacterium]